MATLVMPRPRVPRLEFSRPGANPTLATIELVESALKKAQEPISRNQLLDTLAAWNHATTRQTLNVALRYLGSRGVVAEGSKGLIWVPEAKGAVLDAIVRGRRL